MGILCSRPQPRHDAADADYNHPDPHRRNANDKMDGRRSQSKPKESPPHIVRHTRDKATAERALKGMGDDLDALKFPRESKVSRADIEGATTREKYDALRKRMVDSEEALSFDYSCRSRATDEEKLVDRIITKLRLEDEETVYKTRQDGRKIRLDHNFPGDHFLSNRERINQTSLFKVARRVPKGAHLHIHFNSCLLPEVLLDIAKGMKDRMLISSDVPLVPNKDYLNNFADCEIQFALMRKGDQEPETEPNIFSLNYKVDPNDSERQWMKFDTFRDEFPEDFMGLSAQKWLASKLVFQKEEAQGNQNATTAWKKFNGRTRMMKGLFNYVTAYRKYTRRFLEDLMEDNIQYAEIRPNFMMTNQLYLDDGTGPVDNTTIMDIITEEVGAFRKRMEDEGHFFGGLKVIYCTPRSFKNDEVKAALAECLEFKKRWPNWIAGFDLVGEEASGRPIKDFLPELLDFQENCRRHHYDIPFLFHCGETLDMGTETDGNLVDALLLNSKRIGHGFALAKHPYIMQQMKARGVCLELCPISNEILGLTPQVSGHAMYQLLANNVHCTVSSDNGTLFQSSLSHDFYQVMIGKADMGLYGWKQLILWSLEHSCMEDEERLKILERWGLEWDKFLKSMVEDYGHLVIAGS